MKIIFNEKEITAMVHSEVAALVSDIDADELKVTIDYDLDTNGISVVVNIDMPLCY